MLRDIRAFITYKDHVTGQTWTLGEEHWHSEHEYRQHIHLNSDRIIGLTVTSW